MHNAAQIVSFALTSLMCSSAPPEPAKDAHNEYVIVTDIPAEGDSFSPVVAEVQQWRKAEIVLRLDNDGLAPVAARLRELQPKFVAIIVRPERIEDNFVGEMFQIMTALDDDPLLDAAHGYITGSTAADALNLVRNTAAAEAERDKVKRKFVAIAHTFSNGDLSAFATEQAAEHAKYGFETAGINPIDDSQEWQGKAAAEIQKLNGASLIFLAGHGMGDMSCAIPGREFGKVQLNAAVVVNGTCHSAVTSTRHDSKDFQWTIGTVSIHPRESVCLNFIKAGAVAQVGSTASSSWMNVAFAITEFFDSGKTMGEAVRDSLNDKLTAARVTKVEIVPFADGEKSPQVLPEAQNPGGLQSIARVMLIGDPMYRPYPKAE